MQSISGAEGLTRFLDSRSQTVVTTPTQAVAPTEQLGIALAQSGDTGLSLPEAMAQSNLSRELFLDVLPKGVSAGLFEYAPGPNGEQRLKLTTGAQPLFSESQ